MLYNGKNYELKFTGKTLLKYKEEFHKDMLLTISSKQNFADDVTTILELIWALLKTCDDAFVSYEDWLDSMSISDISKMLSQDTIKEITDTISFDKMATKDNTGENPEELKKK